MQVKKEELKQQIMLAAEEEFLDKGYENSSLRVIAKKANTTLGNIYHYFPSKEALLIEICEPVIQSLYKIVEYHLEKEVRVHSMQEIEDALVDLEYLWDHSDFQYLSDRRLIILLDLKSTPLYEKKLWFLHKFKMHMRWHLNLKEDDDRYADIITNMFMDCLRHVLLEHQDPRIAKEEFLKIFRMLCTGIVINEEK